jgi:hypothetical protein
VTKITAAGTPSVKAASAWNLTECCGASITCGWGAGTQIAWTQSQTLSWSETITASDSVTFKESLLVEGLEVSISLSASYTKGSTRTETLQQTISSPCTGEYTELSFLHFAANVQVYEVPVTITYSQCGKTGTSAGTVTSTVLDGQFDCTNQQCKEVCSTVLGCDYGHQPVTQLRLNTAQSTFLGDTPGRR